MVSWKIFLEKKVVKALLTYTFFGLMISLYVYTQSSGFDCNQLAKVANDQEALKLAQEYIQNAEDPSLLVIDEECLNIGMRRNFFETSQYLINEYFILDGKRSAKAESTVRNAVEQVKNKQNEVLLALEKTPKGISVIAPAFQWAQSLDYIYLSIKFATRFDTPGCLDTFDENITISPRNFNLTIFCKHDKNTMKYELDLDLFDDIDVEESKYELGSVGRMSVTLAKKGRPNRWRRLLQQTEKMPNMQIWWDLHQKHEETLLNHTQFETDESIEHLIHIDNSSPKKSKKPKKDKKKKSKKDISDAAAEKAEEL
eukprot:403334511